MTRSRWAFALSSLWLLAAGPDAGASLLYTNGGFVTGTGTGFNGADVSQAAPSQAPPAGATLGWTASFRDSPSQGKFDFRVADDFTVGAGGWSVHSIDVYGYLAIIGGYPSPPTSYITGATLKIWDANPGAAGAQVVAESSNLLSTDWTGAYRVRTGDASLANNERPIMSATVGFNNVYLGAGSYWLDIFFTGKTPDGNTTVFTPIVMGTNNGVPYAVSGDAYQYEKPTGTPAWNLLTGSAADGGSSQTFAIPFEIRGAVAPEPSSLAMAGMGVAAAAGWAVSRRRTRSR